MIRTLAVLFAIGTITVAEPQARSPQPESLLARVWRFLRPTTAVPTGLASSRSGEQVQTAQQIVVADLRAQSEQVIWECGECWSLAVLEDGKLATAKADGIYIVFLTSAKPELAVEAAKVQHILGRRDTTPGELLIARTDDANSGCGYVVEVASLGSGRISRLENQSLQCLRAEELDALVRPDSVLSGQLLRSSASGSSARRILQYDVSGSGRTAGRNALPWLEQQPDSWSRFGAVWLSTDRIAYLRTQ